MFTIICALYSLEKSSYSYTLEDKLNIVALYRKGKKLKQIQHSYRKVTSHLINRWFIEFPEGTAGFFVPLLHQIHVVISFEFRLWQFIK